MFEKIKAWLGTEPETPPNPETEGRVAVAAVLVEAAAADGAFDDEERGMIATVLTERFGLARAEADALIAEAESRRDAAADLVRFTRTIKARVPHEERIGVVEALWRVVYADGVNDHREAALMRKIGGLLYVEDREVGLARQRVLAERGEA